MSTCAPIGPYKLLSAADYVCGRYGIGLGHGHTVWPDRGNTMDIRLVDADTLAIARLVASAEGITFEQALAEELALWDGVAL